MKILDVENLDVKSYAVGMAKQATTAVSCSRDELVDMKLIAAELSKSEGRIVTLGQALRRLIDTYRDGLAPAATNGKAGS